MKIIQFHYPYSTLLEITMDPQHKQLEVVYKTYGNRVRLSSLFGWEVCKEDS